MAFFDGISFHSFNRSDNCCAWVDHGFDIYAINLASKGYLYWSNDGERFTRLESPVMWWTVPEHHYRYGCRDGAGWEHQWIAFDGPRADCYMKSGLLPYNTQSPFVQINEPDKVKEEFRGLLEYLANPVRGSARAVCMLESLLLYLHEQHLQPQPTLKYFTEFNELVSHVSHEPQKDWDFHKEAHRLCMSYSHFRMLFREFFHESPGHYLIRMRLKHAAALLRAGKIPIKEIVLQIGMDDICYFSKLFKKYYDASPREYQKRHIL